MTGPITKCHHNSQPHIVGSSHTTTGQDWLPYPDQSMDKHSPARFNARHPKFPVGMVAPLTSTQPLDHRVPAAPPGSARPWVPVGVEKRG